MKPVHLIIISFAVFGFSAAASAQQEAEEDATIYTAEAFGSAATGTNTPFWMASNRYGVVPLDAGNGFLRAAAFHNQHFGAGMSWGAGLDAVVTAPRQKNVFIQQLYAELGYKCLLLTAGSKQRYISLWDRTLSSGDMVESANARPIPEVNLSVPLFTPIPWTKGWAQFKGDFAVGKSMDKGYLESFANPERYYIKDVLWHHKSFFVQIKDSRGEFPFAFALGVRDVAQWGGTSTNPKIGEQPHSFKDFIRVVMGKSGGSDATESDQINVLGSHYGSYDFKLSYTPDNWAAHAYYQHYYNDKSGMVFDNGTDGLWGLQLDLPALPWLRKVVAEYLVTMNQSGPLHYLWFDHETHPGRGGGNDDYYNNGEYLTGLSYFNRGLGSPLIPAPEYNADGYLGFLNNRVRSWHFGAEGALSQQVSYRVLFTAMNGWGLSLRPFLEKKTGTSCLVDIAYTHPRLAGWVFTGSVAADTGTMIGRSAGFGLSVAKRGILKRWK